jgi:hypothetical protein
VSVCPTLLSTNRGHCCAKNKGARFAVKGWASNSMAATKQQRLKHLDLLVRKRKKKAVDSYRDNFIDNGATTLGK